MVDKFNNKYRIPSARLKNWDYGSNGAYFITICTHNRDHFFGEIIDVTVETLHCNVSYETIPTMQLSEIGKFAEQFWMEIPEHFPFVELGNFVIMPNHIHGILIIDKTATDAGGAGSSVETLHCNVSDDDKTLQCNVSTDPNRKQNEQMSKISPEAGSISTIIRSYKSVVTKHAHQINPDFDWQSRFHDHIIRNSEEFERIQHYIENNPRNWKEDKFFS